MDMFDLFRETDDKKPVDTPAERDSPPIQNPSEPNSFTYSQSLDESSNSSESIFPSTLAPTQKNAVSNSLVLAIPGSLVLRRNEFQLAWLSRLWQTIEHLRASGKNVAVVVGESPDVRAASRAAHQLSLHPQEIGQAMRASSGLNASLVLRTLSQAHAQVCEEMNETISILQNGSLPVMLGSKDSISMEARAAMLAESMNAKLVVFSEMEIPSNTLHHGRFSKMASEAAFKTNQLFIVDALTALVLARSKIDTLLLSEKHVSKLEDILNGQSNEGTWITSGNNLAPAEKEEN